MRKIFKIIVIIAFINGFYSEAEEVKTLPLSSSGSVMADKIEYFFDSLVGSYTGEGTQKIKISESEDKVSKLNGRLVVDDDFNHLAWYFEESIVRNEDRTTTQSSIYFQLNNGLLYVGKGDAPQYCQVSELDESQFGCVYSWKNPPNRNYKNKIVIEKIIQGSVEIKSYLYLNNDLIETKNMTYHSY